MTAQQIDIFRTIGPTMLPRLIDANELESIDDYGDYAILTYNLAKPVPIKDALDDMEDNMDLNILYHVESFSQHGPEHPLSRGVLLYHKAWGSLLRLLRSDVRTYVQA